jgi:serine/threonine protein kinase
VARVGDELAFPGYMVLGVLGRGGMAAVYKARQVCPERLVAIKVIDPRLARNKAVIARFRQEWALTARLRHPNLVAAYHAGWVASSPFLVMELIDGDNLEVLVRRHGPLPVAQACEVIRQAALGLQHLYEQGLVHRDIKPSNLMLTPAGLVKVLDLGLVRNLHDASPGERITAHGHCLGTLDYMAPEQFMDGRGADIRADIYSLGCTLYELLAGRPPFAGAGYESPFQKMLGHAQEPVPPLRERRRDVPEQLAVVLERMLSKDRDGRFPRPADVAAAMQPFTAGSELTGRWQLPSGKCCAGGLNDLPGQVLDVRVEASTEVGGLEEQHQVDVSGARLSPGHGGGFRPTEESRDCEDDPAKVLSGWRE